MKKVIFSQILTANGTTEFSGLFTESGLPVKVVLEVDDDGIVLTAAKTVFSAATAMTKER